MLMGQETELMPPAVDELKYQERPKTSDAADTGELLTVNLRYKLPEAEQSTKLVVAVSDSDDAFDSASDDFRFAAAVASFGMLLRKSQYKGDSDFGRVHQIANAARGQDRNGYRVEFLEMVKQAASLSGNDVSWTPAAPFRHVSSNPAAAPHQLALTGVSKRPSIGMGVWVFIWLGIVLGVGASAIALGLTLPILMKRARLPAPEPGMKMGCMLKPPAIR
jgi:hypothetical protein